MGRQPRTWNRTVAACVATLSVAAALAGNDDPRPYDLGVRVVAGPNASVGDEVLADLEQVLVDELVVRGCYRSVRAVEDDRREPGQLVLKVRIDEVEKRTDHELSLAASQLSDRPEDRLRYRVAVRVAAVAGLLAAGSSSAVMSKPYKAAMSFRPTLEGQDPEVILRGRLYDDFAGRVASMACRPSAAKLERWIREAADPGS